MSWTVAGWVVILIAVIVTELVLYLTKKPLLTDYVRRSRWVAVPLILFIGMLIGHFFWCECFTKEVIECLD